MCAAFEQRFQARIVRVTTAAAAAAIAPSASRGQQPVLRLLHGLRAESIERAVLLFVHVHRERGGQLFLVEDFELRRPAPVLELARECVHDRDAILALPVVRQICVQLGVVVCGPKKRA